MNYWIDLFTGKTWEEYKRFGAKITGFRARMRGVASRVKPGDVFLCYLTGVMRWVGALEVIAPSQDRSRIWEDEEFPVRFEVRPMILLDPERGVPMDELGGKVAFYQGPADAGKFKGFVRSSPRQFSRNEDGELILRLLKDAQTHPVERPVDPKKLARKPLYKVVTKRGRRKSAIAVAVPEREEVSVEIGPIPREEQEGQYSHTEIQYYLLTLGADMGFGVWVARNDRSKEWNGIRLGDVDGSVPELPAQFNEATQRTIELIDALWLKKNSIVAAFEVESTTSVYSGLLRMNDLLSLQPNLKINLYLVAPDDRRTKVEQEILRPTFHLHEKPLAQACGFIPYSKLVETVKALRQLGLAASLKPDFLEKIAEHFSPDSDS